MLSHLTSLSSFGTLLFPVWALLRATQTLGINTPASPEFTYAFSVEFDPRPLGEPIMDVYGGTTQTFTLGNNSSVYGPRFNATILGIYLESYTYQNITVHKNSFTFNATDGALFTGTGTGRSNAQGTWIVQSINFGGIHANKSEEFYLCYRPPNDASFGTYMFSSDCFVGGPYVS